MKVIILAGGFGTRLSEETETKPKPMVEIGGRPILWHIMKRYAGFGFKEFIIALGYRGEAIKRYFLDYKFMNSNCTVDISTGEIKTYSESPDNWLIHLVGTGLETQTGGRVKKLEPWVPNQSFMLTYGDGIADVNIQDLLTFHRSQGKLVTVTAIRQPSQFGVMSLDAKNLVTSFAEKESRHDDAETWINGGFMVLEYGVFAHLRDDSSFEADTLPRLVKEKQVVAYRHAGFWRCVDTFRDLQTLRNLWESGQAPWINGVGETYR